MIKQGDVVQIFGGYTDRVIGAGTVTHMTKTMATVQSPKYACPVRYRLTGKLAGRRIIGGVAECLNDYINIEG